jgi:hypothetical protein
MSAEFELAPFDTAGNYFILRGLNEGGKRYIEERVPKLIDAQPSVPAEPRGWPWYWVIKGHHIVPRASVQKLQALIAADLAYLKARAAVRTDNDPQD